MGLAKGGGRSMSTKMKLSKVIPAHTKTYRAKWCNLDFMKMSKKYRDVRPGSSVYRNSCYWCKRPHEDGEMMALACFVRVGNRTLCQKCAKELLSSEEGEDEA